MSSTRRQQPPAKGGKQPETGPRVPVFTPQIMGIVFLVLIIVAGVVFYKGFYEKKVQEIASLEDQIGKQKQNNDTYKRKAEMLPNAQTVRAIMDEKLEEVQPMFIMDQDEMREFLFYTFPDVLVRSNINPYGIIIDFEWNYTLPWWYDTPFETIPDWSPPDEGPSLFTWTYKSRNEDEKEPDPESIEPFGQPDTFIQALTIHLEEVPLTYEQLKRFISNLQKLFGGKLYTVHCFRNDSGEISGFLRVITLYEMDISIYMMNPTAGASGDMPEGMPGSETC